MFDAFFLHVTLTYACFNGAAPADAPAVCSSLQQLGCRALFYGASFPLILGFFCVLPRKAGVWSVPGYMSMYVYLLHPHVLFNPWAMKLFFTLFSQAPPAPSHAPSPNHIRIRPPTRGLSCWHSCGRRRLWCFTGVPSCLSFMGARSTSGHRPREAARSPS